MANLHSRRKPSLSERAYVRTSVVRAGRSSARRAVRASTREPALAQAAAGLHGLRSGLGGIGHAPMRLRLEGRATTMEQGTWSHTYRRRPSIVASGLAALGTARAWTTADDCIRARRRLEGSSYGPTSETIVAHT